MLALGTGSSLAWPHYLFTKSAQRLSLLLISAPFRTVTLDARSVSAWCRRCLRQSLLKEAAPLQKLSFACLPRQPDSKQNHMVKTKVNFFLIHLLLSWVDVPGDDMFYVTITLHMYILMLHPEWFAMDWLFWNAKWPGGVASRSPSSL